jgi:hypothetical protein
MTVADRKLAESYKHETADRRDLERRIRDIINDIATTEEILKVYQNTLCRTNQTIRETFLNSPFMSKGDYKYRKKIRFIKSGIKASNENIARYTKLLEKTAEELVVVLNVIGGRDFNRK